MPPPELGDDLFPIRPPSRNQETMPDADDILAAADMREKAMASMQILLTSGCDFSIAVSHVGAEAVEAACVESFAHGWGETIGADSPTVLSECLRQGLVNPVMGIGLLILRKMIERKRTTPPNPVGTMTQVETRPPAPRIDLRGWRERNESSGG